ncbi:vacuolar protein sorting-associated protein 37D isoform X2 [Pezoporus flaviventris]|uniref:vacuolar protein sorting-associated protein 37D isoform X2 n=1 Tax=Pezoporus flaviventris TaxID=889875 RepID=UPI002AAF1019|nr:vacuolar protein sorting-associated protein 37D isoform X2 [Pezoporus flaviventris]
MSRPMSRPPVPPGSPRRLGALSTAQLRALLQDEPRLQRAARLSRKFQSLQLEREMCLASNCTQAKVNLSLRPQLEDGKAALAIKYQELQEIREACWDKQQRLAPSLPDTEEYLENWSPQSALGKLQAKLDASEAESEAQVEQFLAQDLPLDSFLESFCQSRTRSHICRTQLEKLQELLQKDWVGRDPAGPTGCRGAPPSLAPARLAPLQNGVVPKAFNLSYGFVPTFLIPSEAAVPFAMPTAPPRHHLPALGHQPASPCSKSPSLGSPLHLIGHIPLLSPQPSCRQQEQKQELPHR